MKQVLLIICVSLSCIATAQKIRFTDPINKWITMWRSSGGSFDCSGGQFYHFGNDTIINMQLYKPLIDSQVSSSFCESGTFINYWVREDSIANKVYYLKNSTADTIEHTLYNYNLTIGDSIIYPISMIDSIVDTVIAIDSILLNGFYYKIFTMGVANFCCYETKYTYIEGIGCTNSPICTPQLNVWFQYSEILLCFSQDSILPIITVPWFDPLFETDSFQNGALGCSPLSISQIYQQNSSVSIYPNPTTSILTLTSPQPITQITITNLLGQVVFTNYYHKEEVQVDVSNLPNGMYFVTVNGAEIRKFVKE